MRGPKRSDASAEAARSGVPLDARVRESFGLIELVGAGVLVGAVMIVSSVARSDTVAAKTPRRQA